MQDSEIIRGLLSRVPSSTLPSRDSSSSGHFEAVTQCRFWSLRELRNLGPSSRWLYVFLDSRSPVTHSNGPSSRSLRKWKRKTGQSNYLVVKPPAPLRTHHPTTKTGDEKELEETFLRSFEETLTET